MLSLKNTLLLSIMINVVQYQSTLLSHVNLYLTNKQNGFLFCFFILTVIMLKTLILLFLFLVSIEVKSQKIKADFFITYDVEYPIYKKKNTEQFLLFVNTKENLSYYTSTNKYVLDSLKENNSFKGDVMSEIAYDTALGEEVLKRNNNFTVYEKIVDTKVKYNESASLKWVILKDTRKYSGYNTRKAYTVAYGRKWIAWYAENLPLNYGPYKFCGLPGLIINMYDDKAEYFFTLSLLKRKEKSVKIPLDKSYKEFPKKKIKQIKYNNLTNIQGMIFEDPNEKRRMEEVNQRRVKQLPQLDIE